MSYEIFVNASLILALIAALSVFRTVLKMFTLKLFTVGGNLKL